jgi:hypothetical protein
MPDTSPEYTFGPNSIPIIAVKEWGKPLSMPSDFRRQTALHLEMPSRFGPLPECDGLRAMFALREAWVFL